MTVSLKRVYEAPSAHDGARVLVDRLWPRGLSKAAVALDAWLKDLAPSNELRRWYHAHPAQWSKFRQRYLKELSSEEASRALEQLYEMKNNGHVTLLFASKDKERNNAVVLKQLVDGERKPPTGTGPIRAATARRSRAAQRR